MNAVWSACSAITKKCCWPPSPIRIPYVCGLGSAATPLSNPIGWGARACRLLTNADIPFRKWLWMLEESRKELRRFPVPHLEFLRACSSFFETPTHLFVHANCRPEVAPLEESDQILRWEVVDPRWAKPHQSGKVLVVGHTAQKRRGKSSIWAILSASTPIVTAAAG